MVAPDNVKAFPAVAGHVLEMMRTTPPAGAAVALRGRAERPSYIELLTTITHMPNLERETEFNAAVARFLDGLAA
jgi:pimeloyl-ACP methyl ester carboxylesterase